jgi:signal peptidase II
MSAEPPAPGRRSGRLLPAVTASVAAGVVAADQVTKSLVLDRLGDEPLHLFWTLRLNLSFNRGVAFSQGQGLGPVITIAALVLVVVLVAMSRTVRGRPAAVALGLLIGGACGNLTDRLFRDHNGAVIDFIDLQWWPIFNVADMAITAGATLLLLTGLREPAPAKAGDGSRGSG